MENYSNKLLMIKPTNFCTNPETLLDNKYMIEIKNEHIKEAEEEYEKYKNLLIENKIDILEFDQIDIKAVDSIFPNNWLSTHGNNIVDGGLLIIYPMKAESRRIERNEKIINFLRPNYKHFLDLSYLEEKNEYLEGTGSLIFDNDEKLIFCSLSERATENAVNLFIEEFNKYTKEKYRIIKFYSYHNDSFIYHTNCLLSVFHKNILVCKDVICFCERVDTKNKCYNIDKCKNIVEDTFKILNKKTIDISIDEMKHFLANSLNIRNSENKFFVVMSNTAKTHCSSHILKMIEQNGEILSSDLDKIEKVGGGSARCMIAEIF